MGSQLTRADMELSDITTLALLTAAPLDEMVSENYPLWQALGFFFFFFTLLTGPRRALSLELSDTRVYEPEIRTRLGRN